MNRAQVLALLQEVASGSMRPEDAVRRLSMAPFESLDFATVDHHRALRQGFPHSLHQAPALLPTPNTSLRRSLDEWFHGAKIQPRITAEFEDGALMKVAAANGEGFIAVPTVTVPECVTRFRLAEVGRLEGCSDYFFLITGERRITHPAVLRISEHARTLAFT